MQVDDRKRNALKTAAIQSIPIWVMVGLGMIYIDLTEPNNSGHSDFIMFLVGSAITLVLCITIFLLNFHGALKKQDD